ncbi:alpha/beta hydrolase family protein [Paenibacillus sp. GCM10027626]|uniref:alpha/beta hydrolase family protein n=1 Tax=Paenibacillus sp. GCM10027626 TaxID=3273411 RepID=UPI003640AB74
MLQGTGGAKQTMLPWENELLSEVPHFEYAPEYNEGTDLQALFYEGPLYWGKATKVFAYIGLPKRLAETGEKVPAVVLVHGGAGTAYADWVRVWNARGYAAIAMDLEGHLPQWDEGARSFRPHEWAGPANQAVWKDIEAPVKEQWTYHAVAAVIRGHSLLRSLPEIDAERIGIVGVSWGAVLSEIVSGIDERFKFAVPVYGSGFVHESESYFGDAYRSWAPETQAAFMSLWEPSTYLKEARIPMLWVNGDNDGHFPLTVFTKSYRVVEKQSILSIHPGMPHNQEAAMEPPEIYAFADHIIRGEPPLARVVRHETDLENRRVIVEAESDVPITAAELYFMLNISDRLSPVWSKEVIQLPEQDQDQEPRYKLSLETALPDKAKAYYINLIDERGYIVSTGLTDAVQEGANAQ